MKNITTHFNVQWSPPRQMCCCWYWIWYRLIITRWHMARRGRGSEGETGEWSGYPVILTLLRNNAHAARYKCYQLTNTPRLPAVHWPVTPIALSELIHLMERWNLVSIHVPSHSNCNICGSTTYIHTWLLWKARVLFIVTNLFKHTAKEFENFTCFTFEQLFSKVQQRYQVMTICFCQQRGISIAFFKAERQAISVNIRVQCHHKKLLGS